MVNLRCGNKSPITTTNKHSKFGESKFPRVEFGSGYQKPNNSIQNNSIHILVIP